MELYQNYPNPCNESSVISYRLQADSHVHLGIYNLLGQKVATLVAERQSSGTHRVKWNAKGLTSGVYLYRLEAGDLVATKKLILMR